MEECPYLHTPSLLREERERLRRQWDSPKMPLDKSTRVPPPPGRPVMPRISAIDDEVEQDEEEFHESGDFNLIAEFMRVGYTNQYWRAAHREAAWCIR